MHSVHDLIPLMEESFSNNLMFEMPVNGTSMLPFLHNGDYVLLQNAKTSKLKKRDVVFYQRTNGQYVLHRIYKMKKDHYIMLGDNQLHKEILDKNLVLAKMISYSHNKKTISIRSFKYRLYSLIWNIYPLKYLILKVKWSLLRKNTK